MSLFIPWNFLKLIDYNIFRWYTVCIKIYYLSQSLNYLKVDVINFQKFDFSIITL